MPTETIISMILAAVVGGLMGSFGWTWWLRRRAVNITAEQLLERIRKGDRFQLIDVRTAKEYASGHIKGARNLPVKQVKEAPNVAKDYVETIVICDTGRRSLVVYHQLKKMGYKDIKNVSDGMARWRGQTVKS